jgi:WD40 repeat protein
MREVDEARDPLGLATPSPREPAQRLWRRWQSGQRPDLDTFLAHCGPLTLAQLAAVLRVDQRERWRAGERIEAEVYLTRHSALRDDPETAFDLIYNEFLLREEMGETPELGEYLQRFPEFADLLQLQLALHDSLDPKLADWDESETPQLRPRPSSYPSVAGYRIVREIGSGGMGIVYEAWQLGLKRRVALKMVLAGAHASPEQLERFQFEAAAAARLHHPHIVEIHEIGEQAGCSYISLEYVDGGSLAQRLGGAPQPPREAARWVQTLAGAIHYAHQQGVIHRDLKPANVLLTADGVPKIADFGLAKCADDDLEPTRSGTILGSPCYIAPEQASGRVRDVGPTADVYSLGAILYEMLTGSPPFRSATALETLRRVQCEEPVRPTRLQPGIPRDLETICLKCLEKNPRLRYASAQELADELARYLDHKPIKARPLRAPARFGRWCRRQPALAGALGLALLALWATVGVSISFAFYQYQAKARLGAALKQVESHQRDVDLLATNMAYEHGQGLCEQGDVGQGMLWLVRGLKTAIRAGAADLQGALRANLGAWLQQLHTLETRWELSAPVLSVAFRPDGRAILTAADDGTTRLWDVASGKPIGEPMLHSGTVPGVAFSPDGRTILTGCVDARARLWDAATGRLIGEPLSHPMEVSAVAFSPDGRTILTGSWDKAARLWDARTRAPIGQPMKHADRISSVAFSPDGHSVVTGSWDHTARLWDARTGAPIGRPLQHQDFVWSVAFSPDGRRVLTACFDRKARFWDVATGETVGVPLSHQHCVSTVAYSPDGRTVLTGCQDATARLWDAETGQPLGTLVRHQHSVTCAAFSPDGRTVLTGSLDRSVRLWKVARPLQTTLAHEDFIRRAVFSPDGGAVVTGSMDHTARIWDAASGRPIGSTVRHEASVQAVAFSPDGRIVATGSDDGTARLWDARTGAPLGATLPHRDKVWCVAFSPDGKSVLTGSYDKTARLWDRETGAPIGTEMRHLAEIEAVAFSPDGRSVVTGSDDMTARLWDARTGVSIGEAMQHNDKVWGVAFSPDGRSVLTGSYDMTARLWDARTGRPNGHPLQHQGPISVVAFSPDGSNVLTGGWDMIVRQWRYGSGRPVNSPLQHHGAIRALAVSPDGHSILTGSYDRTAQVWDTTTGKPIGPAVHHLGQVWFVAFSPDGRSILTGGQDPVAQIHHLPAPLQGDQTKIERLIQQATGMELLEDGSLYVMAHYIH